MRSLRGLNCLLTGASRGIGLSIVRRLAEEGVNLALVARSGERLDEVAAEARSTFGVRAVGIAADLVDPCARAAAVDRAAAELGPITLLVNNAGTIEWTHFARQTPEAVRGLVELNLVASLDLARMLLPGMLERRDGAIVSVSSLSGKKGIPFEAAYSATKAGVTQWSSALRMELRGTGVGVTVVLPSAVSDVGLFAVRGIPAPRAVGAVPADDVARAVVRGLRDSPPELVVRRGPTRPLLMVDAASPGLGDRIIRALGVHKLHERLARQGEAGATRVGDTADVRSPARPRRTARAGRHLVASTLGCAFAATGTDKTGVAPKIGLLGAKGGPTATIPLLRGSPALNAIPRAECAFGRDQRGVRRPQQRRCDIGAYERKP